MRVLRNSSYRLVQAHNSIASADAAPLYEYGLLSTPLAKTLLQSSDEPTALKLLWLQLVIALRPPPDGPYLKRLRYLELLELIIRNIPDIL